ncbi:iron-containing alcohol dehydrogenase [Arthrobacter sp. NPDC093128]|uniref:iron-containing alcohol dehydrogenase n=1 Tax=Arthrobacter sp. NPDC093128 TaxID=3154979 RepID=UPI00341D33E4
MSQPRVFEMPRIERVIEGKGSLQQIPAELKRRGLERALLLTGRTLGASPEFGELVSSLGEKAAGVYTRVEAHNPVKRLAELVDIAQNVNADVVIGIGGGSAIDAAKLTALGVGEGIHEAHDFLHYSISHGLPELKGVPLPVIAVPTTLSAAEWNGVAAFVDDSTDTKELTRYLALTPNTVVLDPELCALTPRNLWTTTGVRAIDHAVEIAYATNSHPFTTALCTSALRMLAEDLPRTAADATNHEAALRCQQAAWMSLVGVHNVPVGLSHAIGHQLGAAGVPHGVTSCITLPHVMRFYADATGPQQSVMAKVLAEARGASVPLSAPEEMERLFDKLGVPRQIGEFGLSPEALENVVRATMGEAEAVIRQAPRTVTAEDVRKLLQTAY